MPTLLAVDDEQAIQRFLRSAFAETELTLLSASTAAEGLELFRSRHPDVVLLDIGLPDQSGLDAFHSLKSLDPKTPIIFMTGRGSTATAIAAMAQGAYEYLLKPFRFSLLREHVLRALEVSRLMHVPAVMPQSPEEEGFSDVLVGNCPGMQEVYKAIGRCAPQDVTVLILGESGTGKELVARAIYHYSRRAVGPFLAINCAAIPEPLLESELFGHEKGAFTGAVQTRIGKFEQCSGGTLFLDEIGDMTALTQSKVLRVLQEQQFERVGGNESIRTDVRLIAATNRDLERLVAAGQFRQDLYYRLNVYTIHLPPLRDRLEDLPPLVEHFVKRFSAELRKEVYTIDPPAMELLKSYSWPGNLRELQSALKYALLQSTGPILFAEALPTALHNFQSAALPAAAAKIAPTELERFVEERLQARSQDLYAEWLAVADRLLFRRVLRQVQGNLSQAAKILGIHRATLRSKIRSLGIVDESPDKD